MIQNSDGINTYKRCFISKTETGDTHRKSERRRLQRWTVMKKWIRNNETYTVMISWTLSSALK